jgi:membrane-bound serine protease (ClpP class)
MLLLLDANGALLLTGLGLLLICAEFCLPGWVVPGVAGGVCLVCGAYRLSTLGASLPWGFALAATVLLILSAGYGLAPFWLGPAALAAVPWLVKSLLPDEIQWPAALLAAVPPAVAYALLRIAARAVQNKTLLQ